MLKHLTCHFQFKHQWKLFRNSLSPCDQKRIRSPVFKKALFKVLEWNLDVIHPILIDLYSHTGRPALHQIEIFRSLLVMNHFGYTSVSKWVDLLQSDPLYAALCGFFDDRLAPLGSYYDFMNRLYLDKDYSSVFPKDRYKKPSKKLKKGEKLDNVPKDKTKLLYEKYSKGCTDDDRPERILHEIFNALALDSSVSLLSKDGIILNADGSCLHIHSNSLGHRIKDQDESLRRYSDPQANYGWDSDNVVYYFGYTTYFLTSKVTIQDESFDLPLHFLLVPASQHDSLTIFNGLAQLRHLQPDIQINHLCLDSAHDNSSTFQLCHDWNINPVIDLNPRRKGNKRYKDSFTLDTDGTPICQNNQRMVNWGFCKGRHRFKYRCPLKCNKIKECPFEKKCSPSKYGRVIYTKCEELDPRYRSNIKYKSESWKNIYKDRSSCERINNRVLNDYHLQDTYMRTKRRLFFMEMTCCINIHADAWYKLSDFDI